MSSNERTEAVFQNILSTNRHAGGHNLVLAMKRQLTNFDDFATFWQTTSKTYSLWERAYGMQYDQQTAEWTSQLVEYQMEATNMLEAGKFRDQLLKALRRLRTKSLEGLQISPINVMGGDQNNPQTCPQYTF